MSSSKIWVPTPCRHDQSWFRTKRLHQPPVHPLQRRIEGKDLERHEPVDQSDQDCGVGEEEPERLAPEQLVGLGQWPLRPQDHTPGIRPDQEVRPERDHHAERDARRRLHLDGDLGGARRARQAVGRRHRRAGAPGDAAGRRLPADHSAHPTRPAVGDGHRAAGGGPGRSADAGPPALRQHRRGRRQPRRLSGRGDRERRVRPDLARSQRQPRRGRRSRVA